VTNANIRTMVYIRYVVVLFVNIVCSLFGRVLYI